MLLVVFCHFKIPGFGGGFIGPDIFFVLSGYLITGLLMKEYKRNDIRRKGLGFISLKAFYLRRARRILPASLFVVLCINAYAFFTLNAAQVTQVKTDSIWTVLFGANIHFLRQASDYFAQGNSLSPLQHYWSLAVEEQFYALWPILFLTALSFSNVKIRGKRIKRTTRLCISFGFIFTASFVWLFFEFTTNPTSAYFSTFSRAWELALGGLLSLVNIASIAEKYSAHVRFLRLGALVCVVAAVGFVTPNNFGYTLVIPATATGLLLMTGVTGGNDLASRILSNRTLNALGDISFSLYLWHWPVFVFADQRGWMNSMMQRVGGIVLCLLLASLSYWLIERPFLALPLPQSKLQGMPKKRLLAFAQSRILTTATSAILFLGLTFVTYPGVWGSTQQSAVVSDDWLLPSSAASFSPTGTDSESENPNEQPSASAGLLPHGVSFGSYESGWKKSVLTAIELKSVPKSMVPSLKDLPGLKANFWTRCEGFTILQTTDTRVCSTGATTATHKAVILGDSFARVLWPMVIGALDLSKWRVTLLGQGNCPVATIPIPPTQQFVWNKKCDQHRKFTWNYLKQHQPDLVIASQSSYAVSGNNTLQQGLQTALAQITKYSKTAIYIGQAQNAPNLTECVARSGDLMGCHMSPNWDAKQTSVEQAASISQQAKYFNLVPYLCTNATTSGKCPPIIGKIAAYYDGRHLTEPMAKALAPFLRDYLMKNQVSQLVPLNSH